MGLPHLLRAVPFRNALLLRGALTWWIVRLFALFGGQSAFGNGATSIVVVGLAIGLVVFDARRRHEDLFLGNLGISVGAIAVVGGVPAVLAEAALALIVVAVA